MVRQGLSREGMTSLLTPKDATNGGSCKGFSRQGCANREESLVLFSFNERSAQCWTVSTVSVFEQDFQMDRLSLLVGCLYVEIVNRPDAKTVTSPYDWPRSANLPPEARAAVD